MPSSVSHHLRAPFRRPPDRARHHRALLPSRRVAVRAQRRQRARASRFLRLAQRPIHRRLRRLRAAPEHRAARVARRRLRRHPPVALASSRRAVARASRGAARVALDRRRLDRVRTSRRAVASRRVASSRAMRRSDSLTHIEHAMSSVKSLRGRGLDLPNTPRWLRRKHRRARRRRRRTRTRRRETRD